MSPRYAYNQAGTPCAITGGAFYTPQTAQFPASYVNDYFFADFCAGWIRKLDPENGNTVTDFATGIASPVDLKVGDDGALYYLARGAGAVYKITYSASLPSITQQPDEPDGRARTVRDVQRPRHGPGDAQLSMAAQRRQHQRRHQPGLHAGRGRRRQRRPLPRRRQQRERQRPEQRGDADGDVESAAGGHDHRARCRHALQRRPR